MAEILQLILFIEASANNPQHLHSRLAVNHNHICFYALLYGAATWGQGIAQNTLWMKIKSSMLVTVWREISITKILSSYVILLYYNYYYVLNRSNQYIAKLAHAYNSLEFLENFRAFRRSREF